MLNHIEGLEKDYIMLKLLQFATFIAHCVAIMAFAIMALCKCRCRCDARQEFFRLASCFNILRVAFMGFCLVPSCIASDAALWEHIGFPVLFLTELAFAIYCCFVAFRGLFMPLIYSADYM